MIILCFLPQTYETTQLAEAILTQGSPDEEGMGIVLNDTRTRRRSGSVTLRGDDGERQFLVGSDDEDDTPDELYTAPTTAQSVVDRETGSRRSLVLEQDVRSSSSNAFVKPHISNEDHQKPHRRTPSREGDDERASHAFLQNADARTSHADMQSFTVSDSDTIHDYHDTSKSSAGSGLAEKAGIIIGIHNIFTAITQFIMTGLASIIFALLDPTNRPSTTATEPPSSTIGTSSMEGPHSIARSEALVQGSGPNSYVIIYR